MTHSGLILKIKTKPATTRAITMFLLLAKNEPSKEIAEGKWLTGQ